MTKKVNLSNFPSVMDSEGFTLGIFDNPNIGAISVAYQLNVSSKELGRDADDGDTDSGQILINNREGREVYTWGFPLLRDGVSSKIWDKFENEMVKMVKQCTGTNLVLIDAEVIFATY